MLDGQPVTKRGGAYLPAVDAAVLYVKPVQVLPPGCLDHGNGITILRLALDPHRAGLFEVNGVADEAERIRDLPRFDLEAAQHVAAVGGLQLRFELAI